MTKNSFVVEITFKNFFHQKWLEIVHYMFSGALKKKAKQAHLQKVTDINSYQQRALLSTKYVHSYGEVCKAVD